MASEDLTFQITISYDPEQHNGMPARNFLYHFINDLENNDLPVKSIVYKDVEKVFIDQDGEKVAEIKDVALKVVDSVDDGDIPNPDLSDVTKLPEKKGIPDLNIPE